MFWFRASNHIKCVWCVWCVWCVYAYVYVCTYVCMYVWMYVYVCVCVCVCVCVHQFTPWHTFLTKIHFTGSLNPWNSRSKRKYQQIGNIWLHKSLKNNHIHTLYTHTYTHCAHTSHTHIHCTRTSYTQCMRIAHTCIHAHIHIMCINTSMQSYQMNSSSYENLN